MENESNEAIMMIVLRRVTIYQKKVYQNHHKKTVCPSMQILNVTQMYLEILLAGKKKYYRNNITI